jgi:hypothetical protein
VASIKDLQDLKAKDEAGYSVEMYWRDRAKWLASDGKTPVTFTVYGSEAPTYLKRRTELYRELSKTEDTTDSETLQAFVVACAIKSWSGIEEPFSLENARALMAFEFLRIQVERASTRGADFFGDASPGSVSG